ncbi:MAG: hypothetical protein HC854_04540 [Flavobacterium sp.]|nr:hypothetical protein [Flavobacterium sp.]
MKFDTKSFFYENKQLGLLFFIKEVVKINGIELFKIESNGTAVKKEIDYSGNTIDVANKPC